MKHLGLLFTIIISVLPMLWIENYTVTNPTWWTVVGVYILGRIIGCIESEENDNGMDQCKR